MDLRQRIAEARDFLSPRVGSCPPSAVVLGSGLSGLSDYLDIEGAIDFGCVPHYAPARISGHLGKLIWGSLDGHSVLLAAGRIHLYEGYPAAQVAFLVEVLAALGVQDFVLTGAVGSLDPGLPDGSLLVLEDQINLQGVTPVDLSDPPTDQPLDLDMSDLYTSSLRERALVSARAHHIELASGVYVATRGPQLETPAEIRSFQAMGANVVGMSMVQEAIALGMLGAGVLGLCAVTNPAAGLSAGGLSTGSFLEVAASTLPKLRILLDDVLK